MIQHLFRKQALTTYAQIILLIGLYKLGWLLGNKTGFMAIQWILGSVLALYLPGFWIIRILQINLKGWTGYGRTALAVLTSVAFLTSVQLVLKTRITFAPTGYIYLIILLNLALVVIGSLLEVSLPNFNVYKQTLQHLRNIDLRKALFAFLPLFVFLAMLIINPTIDDSDSYLNILRSNLHEHTIPLLARTSFLPLLGFLHFVTNISLVWIYKLFLPALFVGAAWFIYDFIVRHITSDRLQHLTYLTVLIAPVVMIEANIVRPQLFLLCYTVPFFLIISEGLRKTDWRLIVLANWFAFLQPGFHELGLLFVLFAAIVDIMYLYQIVFVDKTYRPTVTHLLLTLVVVYPYTILYPPQSFVGPGISVLKHFISSTTVISWRWWFLNSYTTVDGYNVGWPGIQAIQYYLYNGLLLLACVIIAVYFMRNKQKLLQTYWQLPLVYTSIYAAFAEVLPRFGIYFLPNRAWPHLILGLIATFILYVVAKQEALHQYEKPLMLLFAGSAIIGVLATLYLSYNHVGTVFANELKGADFLAHQTDSQAFVISSQPNNDLVTYYGNREYTSVILPAVTSEDQLKATVAPELDALIARGQQPTITPERRVVTQYYDDASLIGEETTVARARRVIPARNMPNPDKGIYFIYSFAKLDGINGQRPYNQGRLDQVNEQFFKQLQSPNVVYRDNNVLILKLR